MVPCRPLPAPCKRLPFQDDQSSVPLVDRDGSHPRSLLPASFAADWLGLRPRGWASLFPSLGDGQH